MLRSGSFTFSVKRWPVMFSNRELPVTNRLTRGARRLMVQAMVSAHGRATRWRDSRASRSLSFWSRFSLCLSLCSMRWR